MWGSTLPWIKSITEAIQEGGGHDHLGSYPFQLEGGARYILCPLYMKLTTPL